LPNLEDEIGASLEKVVTARNLARDVELIVRGENTPPEAQEPPEDGLLGQAQTINFELGDIIRVLTATKDTL
jgi:hypothetical protein